MIIAPKETPVPISAFVPVENVDAEAEDGVCEGKGRGVDTGPVGWILSVVDCLFVVEECDVAELTGSPDDVKGSPARGNRNLPTPVSQQPMVWSQQKSRLLFVTF